MKRLVMYNTLLLVACTSLLTYTTPAFAESTNETEQSTVLENSSVNSSDTTSDSDKPIDHESIIDFVESAVDANTKEAIPLDTPPVSSQIREELMKEDYHLSKETLDAYTDTQLENAMTLFTRYNYDITGMDYGAYARLLTTLYVDNTVNVEDALTALYYNPNDIPSYSELLKDVTALNQYLSVLYPSNSSFLAIRKMTDDELTQVLTRLSITEQDQLTQGYGKMAPLLYVTDEDFHKDETSTNSSTATDDSTEIITSEPGETTEQTVSKEKKDTLPKTGEKGHPFLYLGIGIAIIGTVVYTYLKKNKRV